MRIRRNLVFAAWAAFAVAGYLPAQDSQQAKPEEPQVRVNYLNVCTPPEADKAEIMAALDRLPTAPRFATDFEIARGRTTAPEDAVVSGPGGKVTAAPISRWVRVRKEFAEPSPYLNVQYSFSVAGAKAEEGLVFRLREPKDVMQVLLSDTVESLVNPVQVVSVRTPVDRIRLERFGKTSLVLVRCKGADQTDYEPLFQKATNILNLYREQLGARQAVAQDLPKTAEKPVPAKHPAAKRRP
ncbi:MAG: hypothetical protein ACM3JB_21780 [Acidobacteriaceae bacterium]